MIINQNISLYEILGTEWGDNGYCYIPFDYLLNRNLANDFWYIGKITKPSTKLYTISYPPVFC